MSIRDDRRLQALSGVAVVSLSASLVLAAVFIANAKSTLELRGLKDAPAHPGGAAAAARTRLYDVDPDGSHTAAIYLATKAGAIAGLVNAGAQVPTSDLADDYRALPQ